MGSQIRIAFAIGLAFAIFGAFYVWREGSPHVPGVTSPQVEKPAGAPAPVAKAEQPKAPEQKQTPEQKQAAGGEPAKPVAPAPATPASPAEAAKPQPAPSQDIAKVDPAAPAKPTDKLREKLAAGAFDVVRVEPTGEMVIAGRCLPDCAVQLTADGRVFDEAKADASGSFAMTPRPLAPGDHTLGLTVRAPDGAVKTSEQTVTVSIPTPPSKEVAVVLNEPNAPSRVLQRPDGPKVAANEAKPAAPAGAAPAATQPGTAAPTADAAKLSPLSVGAVDAENGRFFVQGAAPAGSKLRIYLNGSMIAEPIAGPDGRWSLRVDRGLAPGDYALRVDRIDGQGGRVSERAEAKFDYQPEVVAKTEPNKPAASSAAPVASPPQPSGGAAPAAPESKSAVAPAQSETGAAQPGSSSASSSAASTQPGASASETAAKAAEPAQPSASAPATGAEAAQQPQPDAAAGEDKSNAIVANLDTVKVKRGDSLWRISRANYGNGRRYTILFAANDDQIRNPDLIYPGQVLVLPSEKQSDTSATR